MFSEAILSHWYQEGILSLPCMLKVRRLCAYPQRERVVDKLLVCALAKISYLQSLAAHRLHLRAFARFCSLCFHCPVYFKLLVLAAIRNAKLLAYSTAQVVVYVVVHGDNRKRTSLRVAEFGVAAVLLASKVAGVFRKMLDKLLLFHAVTAILR